MLFNCKEWQKIWMIQIFNVSLLPEIVYLP